MIEDGKELTRRWIEENNIKDAAGTLHKPHGIWTWKARLVVYVAFDDHRELGRRAWYFFTHRLQTLARSRWTAGAKIKNGSIELSSVDDTGAGYLFPPEDSGFIDRDEWIPEGTKDDPNTAVRIVAAQIGARRGIGPIRPATRDEQNDGIDLIVSDPIRRYGVDPLTVEIKSRRRHKRYDTLFLQVSETNPDGIF